MFTFGDVDFDEEMGLSLATLTNYEVNLSLDYTTITKDDTLKMRATQQDVNTESLTYQVESTNQITLYPYKTPTVANVTLTGGGVNEPPTATQDAPTTNNWNIHSVSLEAFNGTTMVHSAEVTDDGAALRAAGVLCSPNQSDGTGETTTTVVNTPFNSGVCPDNWTTSVGYGEGWLFNREANQDDPNATYGPHTWLPDDAIKGEYAMVDNSWIDENSVLQTTNQPIPGAASFSITFDYFHTLHMNNPALNVPCALYVEIEENGSWREIGQIKAFTGYKNWKEYF